MVTHAEIQNYIHYHRHDLSESVIHWTKQTRREGPFSNDRLGGTIPDVPGIDILKKILREGIIKASTGAVKGPVPVVCFSETPLKIMAGVFHPASYNEKSGDFNNGNVGRFLKYHPYGLLFRKATIYEQFGGRPVLYLSDYETCQYVDQRLLWRVVRFEAYRPDYSIDWTHEREWRTPKDVVFSALQADERPTVIVMTPAEREQVMKAYPTTRDRPMKDILALSELV